MMFNIDIHISQVYVITSSGSGKWRLCHEKNNVTNDVQETNQYG